MSDPRKRERTAELRGEMDKRAADWRQRPQPAWMRPPTSRRVLALAPAVTFALGIAAALAAEEPVGVVLLMCALVIGAAGTVLLRRATHMLDNAPHAQLDEREISQRDRGFRAAFRVALGVVGMLWVLAVVDGFFASSFNLFGTNSWVFLTLAALVTVTMAPAAALLWNSDPASEDDE
ncbi:hypothetical protein ACFXQA_02160 [Microbacterium sp. P07]|uniref:hypothetical protein n=1 Tax=Microbacterium sp. P07 TaxID=3366952 RepID=UPI003745DB92